jgi:hypothetical protein
MRRTPQQTPNSNSKGELCVCVGGAIKSVKLEISSLSKSQSSIKTIIKSKISSS